MITKMVKCLAFLCVVFASTSAIAHVDHDAQVEEIIPENEELYSTSLPADLMLGDDNMMSKEYKPSRESKPTTLKAAPKDIAQLINEATGFSPSSKLKKNAAALKAFSTLAADEIADSARHMGIAGRFLSLMAAKSKKSAVQQYKNALKSLKASSGHGLPRYTVKSIRKAMEGKGILALSKGKVALDGPAIGLQNNYPLLNKIHVRINAFSQKIAKLGVTNHQLKSKAPKFSGTQFNTLFKSYCAGPKKHGCSGKKTYKACRYNIYCRWKGSWQGN